MQRERILPALLLSAGMSLAIAGAAPAAVLAPLSGHGVKAASGAPLVLAQSDAAFRVQQLEESIRQLNGRIEDMNFQILQMQEQLRKMQEDNEFRFQQLEGGGSRPARKSEAPATPDITGQTQTGQTRQNDRIAGLIDRSPAAQGQLPRTIDGVEIYRGEEGVVAEGLGQDTTREQGSSEDSGLRTESLGRLVFDQSGNVVDSQVDKPIDLTGNVNRPAPTGNAERPLAGNTERQVTGNDRVASLQLPDDPDQLYELGYSYVQAGDYALAEDAFETFSERYPDHPKVADARFWVGESLLSRGMYQDAARVLLDAHKKYPNSRMGPQTLLKLGVSLSGMNQRELACATFAEVGKQYPEISGAVRAKVAAEQKAASCKAG